MKAQIGEDIKSFYRPYERKNDIAWRVTTVDNMLLELPERYEIWDIIGRGGEGTVFAAKDKETGQTVAIKRMDKAFEHKLTAKRTLRELKLLKLLKHQHILNIETIILPKSRSEFNEIYVVSEYMDADLVTVLKANDNFDEESIKFLLYQLLKGLKYIHDCGVVHRDIKPRNILINQEGLLKICDFGLARPIMNESKKKTIQTMTDYVMTRWYRAPEVLLGMLEYQRSVDIWSTGCVFAEMIRKKPLLPGLDTKNQIELIVQCIGTPDISTMDIPESSKQQIRDLPKRSGKVFDTLFSKISPNAIDLLKKMMTFDPNKRISAEDALNHPFFEDIHYEDEEQQQQKVDKQPVKPISPVQFEFEFTHLTVQQLKDIIYEQILLYHFKDFYANYETKIRQGRSLISHIVSNSNSQIADDD